MHLRKKIRNWLFLALFLIVSVNTFPQKAPVKFGKVSITDLQMKVYKQDTSQSAVILCDYGIFDGEFLEFKRILRIKILNKEGYIWANKVFNSPVKANIRGITYNLENGEIVKTKLQNSDIYAEKYTEDIYRMRVAMPNVKIGSIIDFEVTYHGIPFEWKFQETIPVLWSEFVIRPSVYIAFKTQFIGYEPLKVVEDNHWIGSNIAAFKEEPYMNSIENYLTKLLIDVYSINYPGFHKTYTRYWTDVNNYLLDQRYFGVASSISLYLYNTVKEIERNNLSEIDKMDTAFQIVKRLTWNGVQSVFTSTESLSYVYQEKTGNSADINLILFQLLKRLNFNVFPVVLSTRDNGLLLENSPSLLNLNHVIVLVVLQGKNYLLDATGEYNPYYLLPEKCLNGKGLIVKRDTADWIELNTGKKFKEFSLYDLALKEDLLLKGDYSIISTDYAAMKLRNQYFSFNNKREYLADLQSKKPGIKIISSYISDIENYNSPVTQEFNTTIKFKVELIDNEYYLYPLLFDQIKENPFQINNRQYPVDFKYPIENTIIVNIKLPDSVEVVSLPKPAFYKIGNNNADFSYQVNNNGVFLNVVCKLNIRKTLFFYDEYASVKEFFTNIINAESQPVIFKIK